MSNKDFKALLVDVGEWLSDATHSAIKEAEDLTRRGRLKLEILNMSRQIERKLAELGKLVYRQLSTEPDSPIAADGRIKQLVEKIAKLEAERDAKQREYEAEKKRRD